MKVARNVPRNTYTHLVEKLSANNFSSLKKQILSRYITFFQSLFTSASKEVQHLARVVSRDARSTVFRNIQLIEQLSGLSPWDFPKLKISQQIKKVSIPENNEWRLSLLKKMLNIRMVEESSMKETESLSKMIDSLCNSWRISLPSGQLECLPYLKTILLDGMISLLFKIELITYVRIKIIYISTILELTNHQQYVLVFSMLNWVT